MAYKTMTHNEVNEFEQHIRKAQEELEKAGQMICSVRNAGRYWWEVTKAAQDVGDLCHKSWTLRPES